MSDKDLSLLAKFTTAGLAGIGGWIVVHPFNTVAVRMNLASMSNSGHTKQSFPVFLRGIVAKEGVLTLYQGLSAGITRQVFYATSRFGLFEVLRDGIAKHRKTDIWSRLTAGCVSGGLAALISCPAEVSLVRMSNDRSLPLDQRRNYKGVMDAALRIGREEGLAAFWRGSMPFVNRAILVGACQVGTYDQFRDVFRKAGVSSGFPEVFSASMASGLLYSLITMPFETAKNRMAFQKADATGKLLYTSTLQCFKHIAAGEGVLALWHGFLPYYGRCGGHTVSMFVFLEYIRSVYLQLHGKHSF